MAKSTLLKNWRMQLFVGIFVPGTAFYLGHLLDRHEILRMTKYRDKSALYGRELKPGEEPSWP